MVGRQIFWSFENDDTTCRGTGYCNRVTHNAIEEVEENEEYGVFAVFFRSAFATTHTIGKKALSSYGYG